ncbi:hypothetical protein KL929_003431 [Ogataea haglerorum]|uniref:uncharacterized protein n=1 Tax=Ogataea haglerorum TaxID=1937702 RepID=UPI001C8A64AE|nr:uncharacterized protein KL911_003980 [Ogataea haglerorum]KAG7740557.1 hypothetical protein KL932_002916 [Ogataea haglerorum]KAG7752182.1 hypothetical protein KL911_003980 [Ogataea haglerorum]KAG7787612.1 hypothetical protein KL945_002761 [Ogataea haglerorum]KAG7796240.1 hypothetical protein KL929_003431 [Ogataea haglerorum]
MALSLPDYSVVSDGKTKYFSRKYYISGFTCILLHGLDILVPSDTARAGVHAKTAVRGAEERKRAAAHRVHHGRQPQIRQDEQDGDQGGPQRRVRHDGPAAGGVLRLRRAGSDGVCLFDRELQPQRVRDRVAHEAGQVQNETGGGQRRAVPQVRLLNICCPYTARDDITHAIKNIIARGHDPEDITQDLVSENLYTAGVPKLQLLIRTSGVYRLSDFMLWEAVDEDCDVEILSVLWPQFTPLLMLWVLFKWGWNRAGRARRNKRLLVNHGKDD